MESKEASETLSPVTEPEQVEIEYDFVPEEDSHPTRFPPPSPKEETITVGTTKVIFREPTEKELPTSPVAREDGGFIGKDFFTDANEWKSTLVGNTPNGAGVSIVKRPEGTGYKLSSTGSLPESLKGWFTTYQKAEEAARVYLVGMWEKARAS